jgi:hypothetical protein
VRKRFPGVRIRTGVEVKFATVGWLAKVLDEWRVFHEGRVVRCFSTCGAVGQPTRTPLADIQNIATRSNAPKHRPPGRKNQVMGNLLALCQLRQTVVRACRPGSRDEVSSGWPHRPELWPLYDGDIELAHGAWEGEVSNPEVVMARRSREPSVLVSEV